MWVQNTEAEARIGVEMKNKLVGKAGETKIQTNIVGKNGEWGEAEL